MKVLFLSSWFPNRITPFNGDFVERHALAVSRICHAAVIHVVSDEVVKEHVFELLIQKNQNLLEIIVYFRRNKSRIRPFARLINLIHYGIGYYRGYAQLVKHFGKPDLVHANIIFPVAIAAWLLKVYTGIPYIISEHWTIYLSADKSHIPSGWMIRKAVKNASVIAPVTKNLGIALQNYGYKGHYRVVPNVVDTELFKPNHVALPGYKIKLLHVSSMKEEQKNIKGIIRAIKQLSIIRHDFTVTFVGDAEEHQQKFAKELGLSEIIQFRGEMTHADVAVQMRQSHFLILFSRIENLPCVILEALSSGLPIISSNVGGISEWINDTNGLLVQSGDETAFLKGLTWMLENHSKFNRQSLHQYAVDHFSQDIIAQQFHEIYNIALNTKSDV